MRALLQRVSKASVYVEKKEISSIARGLLIFLGIHKEDQAWQVAPFVEKIAHLRIFTDDQAKMNRSLLDVQGEVLVVSQFTLYGDCKSGRRPDFLASANRTIAEPLYRAFLDCLHTYPCSVREGLFGAHMEVSLVNDGPVTFWLES
ncbi:MAG: D-tyrosyl-tRNA(Tyr) deacylase [Chlamydiae bacterium]|nr:D-tyrosyl-tRNA(Tyr) deacylase [Chlamydiota bacterium]